MSAAPPTLPFARPEIDEDTIAGVAEVLRSGWLGCGPANLAFEAQLSGYLGGRPVRTFNSATSAMETALRVAGIGPGDEVVTTPLSWPATANVILAVGASPVFADVDGATRNIDPAAVEAALTPRTRALLPVHLAGLPADLPRLYAIAGRQGLRVIEDAAQALGSHCAGRRIGAFGDLAAFSFQANKNITTGEGGCLVLNDAAEAGVAERYRLQGVVRSGVDGIDITLAGGKHTMSDVTAAIGLGQMKRLDDVNRRRAALARHYFDCFGAGFEAATGAALPPPAFGSSNWHMFQIILPDRGPGTRAAFMTRLQRDFGIATGFHYAPIHLFTLYRERGWREGQFPVAERIGRLTVTLPLFASMRHADVERVVAATSAVLAPGSAS